MATTLRAVGATTTAAAAVSPLVPGVPAGLLSTDISILVVEIKQAAVGTPPTITTPSGGWTIIGAVTGEATNLLAATDVGTMFVGMYYLIGTYSAPSITTTGGNSAAAVIVAYASGTLTWDTSTLTTQTTTGSDSTSGANGSIAGSSLTTTALDRLLFGGGLSGDLGTITARTLTQASATLLAANSRVEFSVTTGTDSRILFYDAQVTTGAAGIPTSTWTNTSALTGHGRFAVLREGPGAAFSNLTENFDAGTRDATKWSAYGTSSGAAVTNANARLEFTTGTLATATGSLTGITNYALTSSYFYWEMADVGISTVPSKEGYLQIVDSSEDNGLLWLINVDTGVTYIRPYKKVATTYTALATPIVFNSVTHKYLRLSESGGTTSWDYSANGSSWTSAFSVANPILVTSLHVKFLIDNFAAEALTATIAVDNFNTTPTARFRGINVQQRAARVRASNW